MASRRVWKYEISESGCQTIEMPAGAKVLSVAVQRGQPCLWAEVDPDQTSERRHFYVVLTGEMAPADAGRFIGALLLRNGDHVLHVYERTQRAEA